MSPSFVEVLMQHYVRPSLTSINIERCGNSTEELKYDVSPARFIKLHNQEVILKPLLCHVQYVR